MIIIDEADYKETIADLDAFCSAYRRNCKCLRNCTQICLDNTDDFHVEDAARNALKTIEMISYELEKIGAIQMALTEELEAVQILAGFPFNE